jgi:hypothetical protein
MRGVVEDDQKLAAAVARGRPRPVTVRLRSDSLARMWPLATVVSERALVPASIDAGHLLARVAARAGANVSVRAPNTLPLRADPVRLAAALDHLLGHAIQCGAASIELSAILTPDGCVRLQVTADGVGQGRVRDAGLVESVAAAHGGTAGFEADDGGGASTWIAVPTFAGAGR